MHYSDQNYRPTEIKNDRYLVEQQQQELRDCRPLYDYHNDTLRYMDRPIGQGIYKKGLTNPNGVGRPKSQYLTSPSDKIKCSICGKEIIRWNQSHHKKSQICQVYAKMNDKLKDLLID